MQLELNLLIKIAGPTGAAPPIPPPTGEESLDFSIVDNSQYLVLLLADD